jgi:hypothetical protein
MRPTATARTTARKENVQHKADTTSVPRHCKDVRYNRTVKITSEAIQIADSLTKKAVKIPKLIFVTPSKAKRIRELMNRRTQEALLWQFIRTKQCQASCLKQARQPKAIQRETHKQASSRE